MKVTDDDNLPPPLPPEQEFDTEIGLDPDGDWLNDGDPIADGSTWSSTD